MKATGNVGLGRSIILGVFGGIVGGIIFGIMMQMMGKLGMVAGMMGSDSLAVGWVIHMIISVIFGAAFGVPAASTTRIVLLGIVYGVIIWIVGPLVIMPLMMGMGTNLAHAFSGEQMMNLGTHLFFSIIVALVYKATAPKQKQSYITDL